MLKHIFIRNLAVIKQLNLDLLSGLSVFTGETGAGKSILVDALGFVLGRRADVAMLRSDTKQLEVCVSFDITLLASVQNWLNDQALQSEQECILRRVMNHEGRSKAFINGRPSPIKQLKELGALLVDIHGQHAHQLLFDKNHQLTLLDGFGQHQALKERVAEHFKQWYQLTQQLSQAKAHQADKQAQQELRHYQVQEFELLNPGENEWAQLDQEQHRLSHASSIQQDIQAVLDLLDGTERQGIADELRQSIVRLSTVAKLDPSVKESLGMLNIAAIQIQETSAELSAYLEHFEVNPERLTWLDNRINDFYQLARKHAIEPNQLPALQIRLSQELQQMTLDCEQISALQKALEQQQISYFKTAKDLSRQREKSATAFAKQISQSMSKLGMSNGTCQVNIQARSPLEPKALGLEGVELCVSSNPGQAALPLTKVVSGGELSRIGLAIQVITARQYATPTIIFDEVDVGIGGSTAEVVGKLLKNLGESVQVLCVTHLPQVAAQGDNHYQVSKRSSSHQTQTHIEQLKKTQRVTEIARMAGGEKINASNLAHAQQLLETR